MAKSHLTFLHLSDIHFNRRQNPVFDPDFDLRNELEHDIGVVLETLVNVDAIIVTGDIAFSGKKNEYEIAQNWLTKLCELVGCQPDFVWTTPGNHDIDRDVIKNSYILRSFHERLRTCSVESIDEELGKLFEDKVAGESLFRPLENYNQFCNAFGCDISERAPTWTQDLELNDGSRLRLLGLNSVLISNERDNNTDEKLVLGSLQSLPPRVNGVEYLSICHHPPDWLRDYERVHRQLNNRVKIQLFGHKHKFGAEQINQVVRLVAGAVHPERNELPWDPRYNFFTVAVNGDGQQRELVVKVLPRVWSHETDRFKADFDDFGAPFREFRLRLEPWSKPESDLQGTENPTVEPGEIEAKESRPAEAIVDKIEPLTIEEGSSLTQSEMNRARRLTYRFMSLPFHKRLRIAQELSLINDDDEGISESELFLRLFQRAKESGLLPTLWDRVELEHGENKEQSNPFSD